MEPKITPATPVKIKGHIITCPYPQYWSQRLDFEKKNPGLKIIDETKTLYWAMEQMPPGLFQQQPQQILMMAWAIMYEIEETFVLGA